MRTNHSGPGYLPGQVYRASDRSPELGEEWHRCEGDKGCPVMVRKGRLCRAHHDTYIPTLGVLDEATQPIIDKRKARGL